MEGGVELLAGEEDGDHGREEDGVAEEGATALGDEGILVEGEAGPAVVVATELDGRAPGKRGEEDVDGGTGDEGIEESWIVDVEGACPAAGMKLPAFAAVAGDGYVGDGFGEKVG